MELRRFFRGPLLLIIVAVLLLLFVLDYASSGSSYQTADTSQIVSLINQGQVKSAVITDKNQTIQITTKNSVKLGTETGTQWQADWVSGQGLQLANDLQNQVSKGTLTQGYTVSIPKSNALLDLLPTAFIVLRAREYAYELVSQGNERHLRVRLDRARDERRQRSWAMGPLYASSPRRRPSFGDFFKNLLNDDGSGDIEVLADESGRAGDFASAGRVFFSSRLNDDAIEVRRAENHVPHSAGGVAAAAGRRGRPGNAAPPAGGPGGTDEAQGPDAPAPVTDHHPWFP